MASPRHAELDVVETLTEVGRWPAGTAGTVIRSDDAAALIEISDERGHAIDFVSVAHEALVGSSASVTPAR